MDGAGGVVGTRGRVGHIWWAPAVSRTFWSLIRGIIQFMGLARQPISLPVEGYVALATDGDPVGLSPKETNYMRNMVPDEQGEGLRSRDGTSRVDVGNPTADFLRMFAYEYSGADALAYVDANYVARHHDGNVANALIVAGTANYVWDFEAQRDNANNEALWMVNGIDAPRKYRATGAVLTVWPGPPNATRRLRTWKGRMCAAGSAAFPSRLYFSDIGNPESFPGTNFIDIGTQDAGSEMILGLEVVNDNLIVLKQESVWVVYDPTNFNNRKILDVGIRPVEMGNPTAVYGRPYCVIDNRLFFINSQDGVWSTDDNGDARPESNNLMPAGSTFPAAGNSMTLVGDRHGRLWIFDRDNAPSAMVGHIRKRREDGDIAWFPVFFGHSGNGTAVQFKDELYMSGPGLYISNVTGTPNKSNDDQIASVDSLSIQAYFGTSWFGLQESENFERLRRLNVWVMGKTDMRLYKEFDDTVFPPPFSSTVESATTNRPEMKRVRPEVRGKYFRVVCSLQETSKKMEISRIEAVYRGGKEH